MNGIMIKLTYVRHVNSHYNFANKQLMKCVYTEFFLRVKSSQILLSMTVSFELYLGLELMP